MTTQEAIKFGEMYLEMNEDSKDSDTYQFIEVAIEALRKQVRLEELINIGTEYVDRMCKEGNADD